MALTLPRLRDDLFTILRSAIDAVDAGHLVTSAFTHADLRDAVRRAANVDVIAAGKAAGAMLNACAPVLADRTGAARPRPVSPMRRVIGIGPSRPPSLSADAEWFSGGHPLPNQESVAGARRALTLAAASRPGDLLLVLLSGGGSALMALPAAGLTLDDKQRTAQRLMDHGADIQELNTVRKHLSGIKGGQLAAAAEGDVLTLAVSDVVGDDLSVIASGPTVADPSTFRDAWDVLVRRGGTSRYPSAVVGRLAEGMANHLSETPGPDDPRLARSSARVIGPQRGAIDGAARAAVRRGYHVEVLAEPITGEARQAAPRLVERVAALARRATHPLCVIASGETTVTVRGTGKGGRNQEFTFALAQHLDVLGALAAGASIGTDGIDGPTDAAGAIADPTTFTRAASLGIADAERYLIDNNTYAFFDQVGDLIRTGPTSTNVGDLQVMLIA